MKTPILIFLTLCLSCSRIHAQPYQSLFGQHNTYWIQKWENLPGAVRDSFYVEKDTTYNGLEYKKIRAGSHEYSGALMREDTVTGKVWYKPLHDLDTPPYDSEDTAEKLAFDFNLDVGDAFDLRGCTFYNDSAIVVDSVYFKNGRKHIRFDMKPYYAEEPFEMIEGVGSNFGISYKHYCDLLLNPYVICAYKDDTVTYRNKYYDGNCDVRFGDIGIFESKKSDIKIYPNPVIDILYVECPNSGLVNLQVYNANGILMISNLYTDTNSTEVDFRDLSPGLYWLKLSSISGNLQYKILKI